MIKLRRKEKHFSDDLRGIVPKQEQDVFSVCQ